MRNEAGFSLIELLIVVAIILIIAAIAIPSMLRARISANESAMVTEARTIVNAEGAFSSLAGGYGDLFCLRTPVACHTGGGTVPFIDAVLADTTIIKNGYRRDFLNDGQAYNGQGVLGNVYTGYCYGGIPANVGRSGIRSFSGDYTGNLVQSAAAAPCCVAGHNDTATCVAVGS